jgi:hypothetical protein
MRLHPSQSITLIFCIFTLFLQGNLLSAAYFINGKIINAETGEPVSFANVFLAKTTVGTMSDSYGNFSIRANMPPGIYQLVIRHISYELLVTELDFYSSSIHTLEFKLQPRVIKGRLIEIEAKKPVEWEKNLKKFTRMFTGSTTNARQTRILNPEVLDFETSPNDDFTAHSDSILKIENNALGFDLDVILKDFRSGDGTIRYIIYPQFKAKITLDQKLKNRWLLARRKTFEGSFKHFLRSLAAGRLGKEGFVLVNSMMQDQHNYTQDRYDRYPFTKTITVFEKAENIRITGILQIHHKSNYPGENASFEILKDPAIIDTLGNVLNQYSLLASGKWAEERVADLLPQDYQMNE